MTSDDDDDAPKRLTDAYPGARVRRLWDMARNGATDERAAAAAEYTDLIWGDADLREALYDAVERKFWAARSSTAPLPCTPPLPDTDWIFSKDRRGCWCGSRRCNGVVLAVRESDRQPGTYYAVVDGHHLLAPDGSIRNTDFVNAFGAAVAAGEAHAAANEEGEK